MQEQSSQVLTRRFVKKPRLDLLRREVAGRDDDERVSSYICAFSESEHGHSFQNISVKEYK